MRKLRLILLAVSVGVFAILRIPSALAASAPALDDLPLTEIDATGRLGGSFVLLLTGDGGYTAIDREIAAAFKAKGQPVVVLNSLRYFWNARTPQDIAVDIERIATHYLAKWRKQNILLVGYSQGADVLPFAVNRMAAPMTGHVSGLVLLGLARTAVFEFQVMNWLTDPEGTPILPELAKVRGPSIACIYGEEEDTSLCPTLPAGIARVIKLPGGHHFDGDYERVAREVIGVAEAMP